MPTKKFLDKRTGRSYNLEWGLSRPPTREEFDDMVNKETGVPPPIPADVPADINPPPAAPAATPHAEPSFFDKMLQRDPGTIGSRIQKSLDTLYGGPESVLPAVPGVTRPLLPEAKSEGIIPGIYNAAIRPSSSLLGAATDIVQGKAIGSAGKYLAGTRLGQTIGERIPSIFSKGRAVEGVGGLESAPRTTAVDSQAIAEEIAKRRATGLASVSEPKGSINLPSVSAPPEIPSSGDVVRASKKMLRSPFSRYSTEKLEGMAKLDPTKYKLHDEVVNELRGRYGFGEVPGKGPLGTELSQATQPTMLAGTEVPEFTLPDVEPAGQTKGFLKQADQGTLFDVSPPVDKASKLADISSGIRNLKTSYDVSMPFRQGAVLSSRKEFWQAMPKMFKALASEEGANAVAENIVKRPSYQAAKSAGVAFTELGANPLNREEGFMSRLAEKAGTRPFGRAATAYLNELRSTTFDNLYKDVISKVGDTQAKDELSKSFATYINSATGRGDIGGLQRSAELINATIFSPKLVKSRLDLLNPVYYTRLEAPVRKRALTDMLRFATTWTTMGSLAKLSGAADVETDLHSADFGKIKIGNTRIDPMGGFQQYLVALARIAPDMLGGGKFKSTTTGREKTIGKDITAPTRKDIVYRFGESKEAPLVNFVTTLLQGKDIEGNDISVPKEVAKQFVPMMAQDLYDIAQDDPKLLPALIPGAFGMGVQTYSPRAAKSRRRSMFSRPSRLGISPP